MKTNNMWRFLVFILIILSNIFYFIIDSMRTEKEHATPTAVIQEKVVEVKIDKIEFDITEYCLVNELDEKMITAIMQTEHFKESKMSIHEFVKLSDVPKTPYVKGYVDVFGEKSINDLYNTYKQIHKTNIQ